jgi:hypothetical protein
LLSLFQVVTNYSHGSPHARLSWIWMLREAAKQELLKEMRC